METQGVREHCQERERVRKEEGNGDSERETRDGWEAPMREDSGEDLERQVEGSEVMGSEEAARPRRRWGREPGRSRGGADGRREAGGGSQARGQ